MGKNDSHKASMVEQPKHNTELHQTGVRGKKIYWVTAFLILLALLCLINLIVLICLYSVLRINGDGMASMAFFRDERNIKWLLDADFENIMIEDGVIGSFSDEGLTFHGDQQNVTFSVDSLLKSILSVTPDGTFISAQNFRFVNPESKKTILDINSGQQMSVVGEFNGKSMKTDEIRTPRVVADDKSDLTFYSPSGSIIVTGNEGLYGDAKTLNVNASSDLTFRIKDKRYMFTLEAADGVRLDNSELPNTKGSNAVVTGAEKYRLCMCTSTGELFRARITSNSITCAIAIENPCK